MSATDSMVERVARAILESDVATSKVNYPDMPEAAIRVAAEAIFEDCHVPMARAAIEAMRAISLPMETAGLHVINSFGWQHNEKVPLMPAKAIFEAMIDAALSAPTGERGRR
jgi:hypothetical protein